VGNVLFVLVLVGAYVVYVRTNRVPRKEIVRHIALVSGGAAGIGFGQLAALLFPSGPYIALAIPIGLGVIGGLLLWWRARNPALRAAAAGFVFTALVMVLLFSGAN
jgi:hypothetical protein